MKKFIFCTFMIAVLTILNVNAQLTVTENTPGTIEVEFTLPEYSIIDTNIYEISGINRIFKYIKIDDFGILDSVGFPELPHITIDLAMPYNVNMISCSIQSLNTEVINTGGYIYPHQDINYQDTINRFSINEEYYNTNSSLINTNYFMSEPYVIFGQKGISFTVFPFRYNPEMNQLRVTYSAKFEISYLPDDTRYAEDVPETAIVGKYLSNLFSNYSYDRSGAVRNGRILIIVAPQYEKRITYFVNYKRNIGYEVDVFNTGLVGNTPQAIKQFIQNRYDNRTTRPEFVLLVGNAWDIPPSGGNASGYENDDPITDLGYSRLDGNDYFADVYLGRWPVSNDEGLVNIINKTIYMETNIHTFPKRAVFVAGGDSRHTLFEPSFEWPHNAVIKETFEPSGISCTKLYQPDLDPVVNTINDNPLYFIYSGHGSHSCLIIYLDNKSGNSDIDFCRSNLYGINNSIIYPISFIFACQTGNFGSGGCFGETWLNDIHGGVTYFGSSVNTSTGSDPSIERCILKKTFNDEEQISPLVTLGMKRYYNRTFKINKKVKRFIQSYNLIGDPSLNKSGIGLQQKYHFNNNENFGYNSKIKYQASDDIINNNDFVVDYGAEVKLEAGSSISLLPGFHAKSGSNFSATITNNSNFKSEESNNLPNHKMQINNITDDFEENCIYKVYPNPFSDKVVFNIETLIKDKVSVFLYDITGRIITNKTEQYNVTGKYNLEFDLKNQNKGIIIYEIIISDKKNRGKIIKNSL